MKYRTGTKRKLARLRWLVHNIIQYILYATHINLQPKYISQSHKPCVLISMQALLSYCAVGLHIQSLCYCATVASVLCLFISLQALCYCVVCIHIQCAFVAWLYAIVRCVFIYNAMQVLCRCVISSNKCRLPKLGNTVCCFLFLYLFFFHTKIACPSRL